MSLSSSAPHHCRKWLPSKIGFRRCRQVRARAAMSPRRPPTENPCCQKMLSVAVVEFCTAPPPKMATVKKSFSPLSASPRPRRDVVPPSARRTHPHARRPRPRPAENATNKTIRRKEKAFFFDFLDYFFPLPLRGKKRGGRKNTAPKGLPNTRRRWDTKIQRTITLPLNCHHRPKKKPTAAKGGKKEGGILRLRRKEKKKKKLNPKIKKSEI